MRPLHRYAKWLSVCFDRLKFEQLKSVCLLVVSLPCGTDFVPSADPVHIIRDKEAGICDKLRAPA